jgi:hypothetical protein
MGSTSTRQFNAVRERERALDCLPQFANLLGRLSGDLQMKSPQGSKSDDWCRCRSKYADVFGSPFSGRTQFVSDFMTKV